MRMKHVSLFLLFSTVILSIFSASIMAAEKEIKIGVLYPLSGAAATIGRDLQRAAEVDR